MYVFYNNDMTDFIKTTCGGYRTDFTDNFFSDLSNIRRLAWSRVKLSDGFRPKITAYHCLKLDFQVLTEFSWKTHEKLLEQNWILRVVAPDASFNLI